MRRKTVGRGSEDIGQGRILNFAESAGIGTFSVKCLVPDADGRGEGEGYSGGAVSMLS